jgi:hypothetical protein
MTWYLNHNILRLSNGEIRGEISIKVWEMWVHVFALENVDGDVAAKQYAPIYLLSTVQELR